MASVGATLSVRGEKRTRAIWSWKQAGSPASSFNSADRWVENRFETPHFVSGVYAAGRRTQRAGGDAPVQPAPRVTKPATRAGCTHPPLRMPVILREAVCLASSRVRRDQVPSRSGSVNLSPSPGFPSLRNMYWMCISRCSGMTAGDHPVAGRSGRKTSSRSVP